MQADGAGPCLCGRDVARTIAPAPALGMRLGEVGPGRARLSMTVGETMVNGHGMCHGGFIFSLADSAMAFACNAYGLRAVAQHCAITFIRPAHRGRHWWPRRSNAARGGAVRHLRCDG